MCGRFSNTASAAELVATFGITKGAECMSGLPPRYNIAPTRIIPAVRDEAGERAACLEPITASES